MMLIVAAAESYPRDMMIRGSGLDDQEGLEAIDGRHEHKTWGSFG